MFFENSSFLFHSPHSQPNCLLEEKRSIFHTCLTLLLWISVIKLSLDVKFSLRSKSVSVWFRSKRGLSVLTAREMKREPKNERKGRGRGRFPSFLPHPVPVLLLVSFFARSLTLVPHSSLLNRTETLARQTT